PSPPAPGPLPAQPPLSEAPQRCHDSDLDPGSHAGHIDGTAPSDLTTDPLRPAVVIVQQGIQVPPRIESHPGDRLIERPKLLRPLGGVERRQVSPTVPDVNRARPPMDGAPGGQSSNLPARPQHIDRQEIAVQKDGSVLWRRRRHDTKRRLPHSRLPCVDRHLKPVWRSDPRIRPRSELLRGEIERMQQYSKLRDP